MTGDSSQLRGGVLHIFRHILSTNVEDYIRFSKLIFNYIQCKFRSTPTEYKAIKRKS